MKNSVEIERKFIIKIPSEDILDSQALIDKSEIFQTYLKSAVGETLRVRKRVREGNTEYTETSKIRIDKMSAIERERTISEEEYLSLLGRIRDGSRTLNKTRYTFPYGGYLYEIDVYPQWHKTAIMEVELASGDEEPGIPPFIELIDEVTGMKEYSNSSMSMHFPDEVPIS